MNCISLYAHNAVSTSIQHIHTLRQRCMDVKMTLSAYWHAYWTLKSARHKDIPVSKAFIKNRKHKSKDSTKSKTLLKIENLRLIKTLTIQPELLSDQTLLRRRRIKPLNQGQNLVKDNCLQTERSAAFLHESYFRKYQNKCNVFYSLYICKWRYI